MKQILQNFRSGELWLADVDPPGAGHRGVRLHTRASLVSAGTEGQITKLARKSLVGKARARPDLVKRVVDKARREGVLQTLAQVRDKLETSTPLGYSCAGVVTEAYEAGPLVPGMRVACGGAGYANHAEVNWVPRNLAVPIPDAVSFEEAAFATVGAIALQGVRQARIEIGDRVVVTGMGLIGLLCVQLARAAGAVVMGYDPSPTSAGLARTLGCARMCTAPEALRDEVLSFTGGHGADAVIVAASAPTSAGPMTDAVDIARLRGRIAVVGAVAMEFSRDEAYRKELEVRLSMSYGPGRYDARYEEGGEDYPFAFVRYSQQRNLAAFLDLVADGRVRVREMISHRYPFPRALEAYELITANNEPFTGILLTYGEPEEVAQVVAAPRVHATPAPITAVRGKVGIGVLGAGNYTRAVLFPALQAAGAAMVGVVNRTGPSAKAAREAGGFRYAATDPDALFADPNVHAVVIGTRHDLHADLVVRALEAGKHVLVEKPLCLTADELEAIATAQASAGRYVQVGTNRRFSPYTRAVLDLLAPRIGPLAITCRINAGRLPADHWLRDRAVGGGRLLGEGVHFVDWCHAVVGAPITRCHTVPGGAVGGSLAGDTWATTLSFSDGSVAQILYAADGDRGMGKERYEVLGGARAASIDDWSSGHGHRSGRSTRLRAPRGQRKGAPEAVSAFLRAVTTGVPAVPLADTWHVMQATLAADTSRDLGAPVDVCTTAPADAR